MSTQTEELRVPGRPLSSRSSIYELRFKKGRMMQTAHFSSTSLEAAITLGRKYCEKNALQFIYVNEWELDLQELLDRKEEFTKTS